MATHERLPQHKAYLELKVVDEGIEVLNQEIANLTQKIENTRHRLVTLPKKRFLIFWQHETPTHDSLRFHISNLNKKIEGLNERVADRRKERRHVVHLIAQQEKIIREVEPIQKQLKKEGIVVFNDDFWRQTNEKRQQALPNNSRVLQNKRARLFIAAMRLRKVFICEARVPISNAWEFFAHQDLNLNTSIVMNRPQTPAIHAQYPQYRNYLTSGVHLGFERVPATDRRYVYLLT